jgi:hypothetical protein
MGAAGDLPRLYCDFNDGCDAYGYWLLIKDGIRIGPSLEAHGLQEGDRVVLYQDEDDFEVEATLRWGGTGHDDVCWVAIPDWDTRRDLA